HLQMGTARGMPAEAAAARLEQAREIVDRLIAEVRGLSLALRPAALDQLGLLPALISLFEWYTGNTGIRVEFKHTGLERRFPSAVETAAYRIVQEALTNVARHAGVSEVTVRVWADEAALSAQIEDEGGGFDPEAATAASGSVGLRGMQERVLLLSGNLSVDSR